MQVLVFLWPGLQRDGQAQRKVIPIQKIQTQTDSKVLHCSDWLLVYSNLCGCKESATFWYLLHFQESSSIPFTETEPKNGPEQSVRPPLALQLKSWATDSLLWKSNNIHTRIKGTWPFRLCPNSLDLCSSATNLECSKKVAQILQAALSWDSALKDHLFSCKMWGCSLLFESDVKKCCRYIVREYYIYIYIIIYR